MKRIAFLCLTSNQKDRHVLTLRWGGGFLGDISSLNVISRPSSRDSSALEFILSRSRSRSRDLKTQVSVLVSRSKKGLGISTGYRSSAVLLCTGNDRILLQLERSCTGIAVERENRTDQSAARLQSRRSYTEDMAEWSVAGSV